MSIKLPQSVQNLIDSFNRLPGIGPKMAARLTFHLLERSDGEVARLMQAVDGIRSGIQPCQNCGHIAEGQLCSVCASKDRVPTQICIVEGALDVIALEKSGLYHGLYHVLGGVLSPLDGVGPEQLRLGLLVERVRDSLAKHAELELIIATNPSLEGEATANYIQQLIDRMEIVPKSALTLTRIARGLPMGSDIEYADPTTLARAMEGRRKLQ